LATGFTIAGLVSPVGVPAASLGQVGEPPHASSLGVAGVNSGQIVLAQERDDDEDPERKALEPDEPNFPLQSPPSTGPPFTTPYIPFPIEGRNPRNALERDAMHWAMEGQGTQIMKDTRWGDPRFQDPGWIKMQYVLHTDQGNITVHYMKNTITGHMTQFKFKYPE
jgi:hypothetical protein